MYTGQDIQGTVKDYISGRIDLENLSSEVNILRRDSSILSLRLNL